MKAVSFFVVLAALLMAARPGTEQQLVQQLNGQPSRFVMVDGGRSGIFETSSTTARCMPLAGAKNQNNVAIVPNVLLLVPLTAGNLCVRPSVNDAPWDGGCNVIPHDENYGVPLAVGVPQYVTPDSRATHVCFAGDAGSISVPVWWAQ